MDDMFFEPLEKRFKMDEENARHMHKIEGVVTLSVDVELEFDDRKHSWSEVEEMLVAKAEEYIKYWGAWDYTDKVEYNDD